MFSEDSFAVFHLWWVNIAGMCIFCSVCGSVFFCESDVDDGLPWPAGEWVPIIQLFESLENIVSGEFGDDGWLLDGDDDIYMRPCRGERLWVLFLGQRLYCSFPWTRCRYRGMDPIRRQGLLWMSSRVTMGESGGLVDEVATCRCG